MFIDLISQLSGLPEGLSQLLDSVAQACVQAEGVTVPVYAALQIVDDAEIHAVNLRTRDVDRPTDVLSFPTVTYPAGKTAGQCPRLLRREFDPEAHACFLGDILLSYPRAQEQALTYGHSLRRELCYLTAHAMLHLMGYDHMTESDRAQMRAKEEQALLQIAPRIVQEEPYMTDQELFAKACEALTHCYCPYSQFRVGAALLCEDGTVFTGVNVENASYGATNCAERSAVFAAVSQGHRRFVKIAIAGGSAAPWPCGICRQVLSEFALPDFMVIVGENGKTPTAAPLSTLLPASITPGDLGVEV